MGIVNQESFNKYRETKIIEVLQKIATSSAGRSMAFKGGTALRFIWGLPRYSEDLDFTLIHVDRRAEIFRMVGALAKEAGYEVTDAAKKFRTLLYEFRFKWEGPNFHLKIEISNPMKMDQDRGEIPVRLAPVRGVPILVLREERLTAQKLCALFDREVARDLFDFWFILEKGLKVDWAYVLERAGMSQVAYFEAIRKKIANFPARRLLMDVGKLVGDRDRAWLKTNFLRDLDRMIEGRGRQK